MPLPSGVHFGVISTLTVGGTSKVLTGAPPSNGIIAIRQMFFSSLEKQAMNFPSEETCGSVDSKLVSCCAVPPSIGFRPTANRLPLENGTLKRRNRLCLLPTQTALASANWLRFLTICILTIRPRGRPTENLLPAALEMTKCSNANRLSP